MSHQPNVGKIITRPNGKTFHIGGRKLRPSKGPRLRLSAYLDTTKFVQPVPDVPYPSSAALQDVLANDVYGDCTCAGALHGIEAINLAAGVTVTFTRDDAIKLYQLSCGFDPNNPQATDNGGDELTVLDFIAEKGIDGNGAHKTAGSLLVDAANDLECRWVVYNLRQLYYGVGLPDPWVNPFPSTNGFVWDVAGSADPNNGHCFVALGTNSQGDLIDTWGEEGVVTKSARAAYAVSSAGGELHTIVTPELIVAASQTTPTGLGWQDLLSDLQKLGQISS